MRLYLPSADIDQVPGLLSGSHLKQQGRFGLEILLSLHSHRRWAQRIRYSTHLSVQMWEPWLPFLLRHIDAVAVEIGRRQLKRRTLHERLHKHIELLDQIRQEPVQTPTWIGYQRMFESHRAFLLHVEKRWYSQHDWQEPPSSVPTWPALLPEVGDTMMDPDGELWTVGSVTGYEINCLRSDEVSEIVPTEDIYTRRWKRVIED